MGSLLRNIDIRFVSLQAWPGERTKSRTRSQFSASFASTCETLERELLHLRAKHVVIQADCDESQIRRDGMLRTDARTRTPGIILSFDSKHGPLSYPCDRFMDWHDNLRAIALGLEALRTVDRYGVTKRAEQYKGWKALTFRGDDYFANEQEAAVFLAGDGQGGQSNLILSNFEAAKAAYKRRSAASHPDAGGSDEVFKRVTAAWEMIRAWHERRRIG